MSKTQKQPLRKCTGCNEMKPKKELIKVVKTPQGEIQLDPTGKMPGRGAYICKSRDCMQAAKKQRRLERSLSCKIPEEVYSQIEKELESCE